MIRRPPRSTRLIVDEDRKIESSYEFFPFGSPKLESCSNLSSGFHGKERDDESGLNDMSARFYSAAMARFISVDPDSHVDLETPVAWNRYSYVENNPVEYVDPTGMFKIFGRHRHQNISRAAPVQAVGVAVEDVVHGNFLMDAMR